MKSDNMLVKKRYIETFYEIEGLLENILSRLDIGNLTLCLC